MKLLRHFIIIYCLNSTGLLQAETHGNDAKVKDPLPTLTDCPKPSTSPLFVLVKQLDGTERNAELLSLTEKELKLSGDSNRIPLSEIESIQFPPAPKKPLSTFKIVELLEGGHLYAKSLSLNKASDKITVTLLNNKQVELPSKQVSATRFNVHPKTKQKLDKQWQEIVTNSKDADGDILIIKDRAPDYITGFIESISDKNIEFKYEGEVRTIDRERVLAVKLLHSQKPAPSHKIWVNTSDGSRVPSTSLTMESGNIRAKTEFGEFCYSPDLLSSLDFATNRSEGIEEVVPEKTETKPTLKFESEFLTKAILPQPTETSLGGEIKKGLLVRNGTQLTYALRKQYKSFRGLVGIADEATETGNATVTIEDEKGKVLWQQKMKQGEKPKPIELNLEEINRLLVKVNGSETGDLVVLNGRLLKMQDSIK